MICLSSNPQTQSPCPLPPAGGGEVNGGAEPDGNTILNDAVREMSGRETTQQADITSNSPVMESVESFDSLASNNVQSDLPIKRLIQSEISNLKTKLKCQELSIMDLGQRV